MGEVVRETPEERELTAKSTPKATPAAEHDLRTGQTGLRVAARKGEPSGFHRTASAVRTVVPLLQKLLPLLDGNVASAAANLLAPRLLSQPSVDLSPLETSLTRLRGDLALIQERNAQHDVAFKRIDDQLEVMKEAVVRTAAEQRELAADVNKTRKSVLVFSVIGILLLVLSIGLNAVLFLYKPGGFR